MMCLLWPLLLNPPLWPVAIGVSAIAIGTALMIANVNPILGLMVALF
jgi:hypothetical protein